MTEDEVDPFWADRAWSALALLAESGRPFVAHEIVTVHGVGEPAHHSRWGQLLATAHRRGLIEPVGAAPSPRRTVAGSLCRVWRGVGCAQRRAVAP